MHGQPLQLDDCERDREFRLVLVLALVEGTARRWWAQRAEYERKERAS